MAIVGGFDVHRNQITFDCLDTEAKEVSRGEIRPATRVRLSGLASPIHRAGRPPSPWRRPLAGAS